MCFWVTYFSGRILHWNKSLHFLIYFIAVGWEKKEKKADLRDQKTAESDNHLTCCMWYRKVHTVNVNISRIHFYLYLLILKVIYCDIKCFIAQAVSDIWTNSSVKCFRIQTGCVEGAQDEKEESTNNVLKTFFCINPSLRPSGTTAPSQTSLQRCCGLRKEAGMCVFL